MYIKDNVIKIDNIPCVVLTIDFKKEISILQGETIKKVFFRYDNWYMIKTMSLPSTPSFILLNSKFGIEEP